jgi:hypothetical protein
MNSTLMLSSWGMRLGKKLMKGRMAVPEVKKQRWNIVRGDQVQVIKGPQSGQKGKVLAILKEKSRVIVDGVNMVSSPERDYSKLISHRASFPVSVPAISNGKWTEHLAGKSPCPVHYTTLASCSLTRLQGRGA